MVFVYESGSSKDPDNCKPIPLLSTFSKVLEEFYYTHLLAFINRNNVLHNNQFGFKPGKSTSLASTLLLCSLLAKYIANKKTVLALLDIKNAFDLINHELSIIKLQCYGVRGIPLK
jgi:hypothetical protein